MQKKIISSFIGLCLFCNLSLSQTYAIPQIGVDISGIHFEPINSINYRVDSSSSYSFLLGASIQQELNKRINLTLDLLFTTKKYDSYSGGSVPNHKFEYTSFRSVALLNCRIVNKLYFGLGTSFNFLSKIKVSNASIYDNKRAIEGAISIIYYYNNINIIINYYHLLAQGSQQIPVFKNPNTFNLKLGYRIKFFKGQKN